MLRHKLAKTISLLTAPQVYGGLVACVIWLELGIGGTEALLMLFFTQTIMPLLPIVIDTRKGTVDVFVSEREKRPKYYLLSILSYTMGIAYALLRNYRVYAVLALSYFTSAAALAAVTAIARWKISVHAAGISGPTTALILTLGFNYIFLYLLLVPVAWARLEMRAHTIAQLIAGAMLAFATTVLTFNVSYLIIPL